MGMVLRSSQITWGGLGPIAEKKHLHESDNNVIESVEDFLQEQDELFYKTGIHKVRKGWNKCIEVCRDYVEKETGQCSCIFYFYMRPQTFGTTLVCLLLGMSRRL